MSTPSLTERGFVVFGEVTDDRGNVVRVQESSAMGDEPYCWVFTHNHDGNDAIVHLGKPTSISPHLTRAQARELATLLLQFADGDDDELEALRFRLRGSE